MKIKRLLVSSVVAVASCVAVFALFYAAIERPAPINPMKLAVINVALGSTADDADVAMGMPPVSVTNTEGYLVSPVTMLAAENELAPKDQIETYSLRKYENNGNYAVVAIGSDGLVAGRWAGSVH